MTELRFPTPPLADKVVLLRPWRATDVPDKLMAFSDPVVQRFAWSRTTPYTEADARRHFVEQEQARLRGEALTFALVAPGTRTSYWAAPRSTTSTLTKAAPGSANGLPPRRAGRAWRRTLSASSPAGRSRREDWLE